MVGNLFSRVVGLFITKNCPALVAGSAILAKVKVVCNHSHCLTQVDSWKGPLAIFCRDELRAFFWLPDAPARRDHDSRDPDSRVLIHVVLIHVVLIPVVLIIRNVRLDPCSRNHRGELCLS